MLERDYQAELIKELHRRFPGCFVLKNDTDYLQGIPDLLVLYKDRWVALEVKASRRAGVQPNQDYYVEKLNEMSYAAFIYPENENEVLNAIQQSFKPSRATRVPKRKQVPLD